MGSHYPAMTLVEVKGLVEEGAVVEIEATAVIPTDGQERSMALNPTSFLYEHDADTGVATITLNRPGQAERADVRGLRGAARHVRRAGHGAGVRAIVLTGSGRAFCSGGDVEDIIGRLLGRSFQELLDFTRITGALIHSIRKCRRPVVGALNGTVAGAGSVIAAACDIRIAAESAKIAFLFTRVGLSGADMGASWLLPRIVGHGHASYLLMTGDFIDAREAERIGLYNRVVGTGEEAWPRRRRWRRRLARGPVVRARDQQGVLDREWTMDLDTALAWETQVQAGCMLDPNFAESHAAFRDRREPRFD
jgi:enoyl-CoA hydratase/carnithine racemase